MKSPEVRIEGRVLVSEGTQEGSIFLPFVKLQRHAADFLTNAALDPRSKIPGCRVCAVRIDRMDEEARTDEKIAATTRRGGRAIRDR